MNSREAFRAARDEQARDLAARLRPVVRAALTNWDPETEWYDPIVRQATALWQQVYAEHSATSAPTSQVADFSDDLTASLRQTTDPGDDLRAATNRITDWVVTYLTNDAVVTAAASAEIPPRLEWVSMRDDDVRSTHVEADGQVVDLGEPFRVCGTETPYPGAPVGPIECWINCRCAARIVEGVTASADRGGEMSTIEMLTAAAEEIVDDGPEWSREEVEQVAWHGVLAPLGVWSGDRRRLSSEEGAITHRDLPVPLRNVAADNGAHDGAVAVARIDRIFAEDGLIKAEGIFHDSPEADEAIGMLAAGIRRGVSVDLDDLEAMAVDIDGKFEEDGSPAQGMEVRGRIAAATLVDIPAFQEAYVALGPWQDEAMVAAISDAPWDGAASRFTDEEWRRSCVLDRGESYDTAKTRYGLPIREPNGDLSRAAVHNAAARINQVDASPEAVSKAKGALRRAYGELDEEVPEVLQAAEETEDFARGPGWITHPKETSRLHRYWTRGEGAAKIRWGEPNDFYRCRRLVGAKIAENSPEDLRFINRICAQWHHDALGIWPGQHAGEKAAGGTETMAASITLECPDCVETLVASADASWFADPHLDGPTPLTITDEGRIFGHLATWDTCHIGFGEEVCVTAPHSASGYAYFRTGVVRIAGVDIPVGQITMGTGHAPLRARSSAALAHYDNTGTSVADLAAGEDSFGIWVAGAMRPDTTDEQREALRAASLSGDWRRIGGKMELVAALAVNVPGFPIPRPALAASGVDQVALVAAAIVAPWDQDISNVRDLVVEVVAETLRAQREAAEQQVAQAARALRVAEMKSTMRSLRRADILAQIGQ